jgi:hypothetical protein
MTFSFERDSNEFLFSWQKELIHFPEDCIPKELPIPSDGIPFWIGEVIVTPEGRNRRIENIFQRDGEYYATIINGMENRNIPLRNLVSSYSREIGLILPLSIKDRKDYFLRKGYLRKIGYNKEKIKNIKRILDREEIYRVVVIQERIYRAIKEEKYNPTNLLVPYFYRYYTIHKSKNIPTQKPQIILTKEMIKQTIDTFHEECLKGFIK